MKLILESVIKNTNGIIDVGVIIINDNKKRQYTYRLKYDHDLDRFQRLYNKGTKCHGKALQVLVKNNLKEVM